VILLAKDKRTKLTDKEEKKIIADYVETNNYSEVARLNGVSVNTVRRVIERQDNDELEKKVKQKKEENTKSTLEYMEEQHEVKKRLLDKLLKGMEVKAEEIDMFTNIKDLATAYGIILDKELKLKEINQKLNENTSFENINAMITNIATLINSPVSNRTEDNIDE
jgi:transposase